MVGIIGRRGSDTVASVLFAQSQRRSADPFLVFEREPGVVEVTSWADQDLRARRTAAALSRLGVQRGTRFGVHLTNCPDLYDAWFAAAYLGAVMVPTNPLSTASELAYMLSHSGCRVVLTERDLAETVHAAGAEVVIDVTGEWAASTEAFTEAPRSASEDVLGDLSGWDHLRSNLMKLLDVGALISSYGWSEQFIDDIVLNTPDFNVMAGERPFAEWLSAIEMGLAMGSALLAAQDEGLGTQLLTGKREQLAELLGIPDGATVAQIQLLGYPAEGPEAGGQRPRPDFEELYFEDKWGQPLQPNPDVTAELIDAGEIQAPAPLPHRRQELRALAAMFGLPD